MLTFNIDILMLKVKCTLTVADANFLPVEFNGTEYNHQNKRSARRNSVKTLM